MTTYVPNAIDTAEPGESQSVESAALEFRTLKARTNALATTVAGNLALLQAEDTAIISYISPYIDELNLINFPSNFDLGFVYDPVPPSNVFDFGSI